MKGSARRKFMGLAVALVLWVLLAGLVPRRGHRCPQGSVAIDGTYCIDRYEGSLVEVLPHNHLRPWSPFDSPVVGTRYRAVSRPLALPQGYISQVQARAACVAAGRRLCTEAEWSHACKGPRPTPWPYGPTYIQGRCNDGRTNPVPLIYGLGDVWHEVQMNDPRLNRLPGGLARSGQFARCTNGYGVHDMVGNLHEWVEGVHGGHGVFRGGYYVDVHINGEGCDYATRAHYPSYHDYSTGFRCCADL